MFRDKPHTTTEKSGLAATAASPPTHRHNVSFNTSIPSPNRLENPMVRITEVKKGKCSLSGKECTGVVVTFDDKSFENLFLSWNALRQLLELKLKQVTK